MNFFLVAATPARLRLKNSSSSCKYFAARFSKTVHQGVSTNGLTLLLITCKGGGSAGRDMVPK